MSDTAVSNAHDHVPVAIPNAILPRAGARITIPTNTKPSLLETRGKGFEGVPYILRVFNGTSLESTSTEDGFNNTLVNALVLEESDNICIFNELLSKIPTGDVQQCCNSTGGHEVNMSDVARYYNFEVCQYNAKKDDAKDSLLQCVFGNAGASHDTHHLCLDEDGEAEPDAGTALRVGLVGWLVVGLGFASALGVGL